MDFSLWMCEVGLRNGVKERSRRGLDPDIVVFKMIYV